MGSAGTLYTTTQGQALDGNNQFGDVVALSAPTSPGGAWSGTVIFEFQMPGAPAGLAPFAGPVLEGASLIGTSSLSGNNGCLVQGCGSVYELTPTKSAGGAITWTETTLYTFTGPPNDGANSYAPVSIGPGGVLYGTTFLGGSGGCVIATVGLTGCGTVFRLSPPASPDAAWTETVLYSFTGSNGDGAYPMAGVTVGANGNLYGTTPNGGEATSGSLCNYEGVSGCGTVFELTPPTSQGGVWTERVLHSFSGQGGDGANPMAGLTEGSQGALYGTTAAGGTQGRGTIFSLQP